LSLAAKDGIEHFIHRKTVEVYMYVIYTKQYEKKKTTRHLHDLTKQKHYAQ